MYSFGTYFHSEILKVVLLIQFKTVCVRLVQNFGKISDCQPVGLRFNPGLGEG